MIDVHTAGLDGKTHSEASWMPRAFDEAQILSELNQKNMGILRTGGRIDPDPRNSGHPQEATSGSSGRPLGGHFHYFMRGESLSE